MISYGTEVIQIFITSLVYINEGNHSRQKCRLQTNIQSLWQTAKSKKYGCITPNNVVFNLDSRQNPK
jgi:hypothetical protein